MTPQEARKLLGGYATGTLTQAEQEALLAAALEDQDLFDEIAREQSLREVLADPAARASLLGALNEPRRRWWQSWQPWAAAVAMAGIGVLAVSLRKPPAAPVEMARVEPPAAPKVDLSAPTPVAETPRSPAAPRKRKAAPISEAPQAEMAKNEAAPPSPPAPKAEAPAQAPLPAASPRSSFRDSAAQPQVQAFAVRSAALPLSLRYTILRENGAVRLRFTANAPGYLSVGGATPVPMVLTQPYTTPALTGDEVKVIFARQPVADAPLGLNPDIQERDGETYVTNLAQNEPLVFSIPLKQP
jgi:hypothetical protein